MVTLNQVLADETRSIDFVSIDVEGAELAVLRGLDLRRFAPTVLVIEDNSLGRDQSVDNYLREQGYVARYRTRINVFYTPEGEAREFSLFG